MTVDLTGADVQYNSHLPDEAEVEQKAWVPYVGPEGGEGWQETGSGDVRYTEDAPGEAAGEELLEADDDELLDAVAEVFDEESAESLEGMSAEEIRLAVQSEATADELAELGDAVGGNASADVPDGPVSAEDLAEGDEVVIDGQDATVTTKKDMGSGFYIAGETDDGETVTARVGPGTEFEAVEDDEPEGGTITADEVSEGDTVVIDGTEGEVTKVSDMGGGYYIAAEADDGEVLTARVGKDQEFETTAEGGEGPSAEELGVAEGEEVLIEDGPDEPVTVEGVDPFECPAGETQVETDDGQKYCVVGDDLSEPEGDDTPDPTSKSPGDYDISEDGFDREFAEAVTTGEMLGTDAIYRNMGKVDDEELVRDALLLELQGKQRKTATDRLESKLETLGGDVDQVHQWANSETPGGGGDGIDFGDVSAEELDAALQKVVDRNKMTEDVADYIRDNDMDAEQIESYLSPGKLDALEDVLEEGVDVSGDVNPYDFTADELRAAVRQADISSGMEDAILGADSASGMASRVDSGLNDEERQAVLDALDNPSGGYESPFDTVREDLRDALNNPSDLIGNKGGFNSTGQRVGYDKERLDYLAEEASTEDLETEYEAEFDEQKRMLAGLLHTRDDSDVTIATALDTEHRGGGVPAHTWAKNLNRGFDKLDPAIAALTAANIEKTGTDDLSGRTAGVWKSASSTMWTDSEGRRTSPSTTKHEICHAMHYAIGVTGRSRTDNSNSSSPDDWQFNLTENGDTEYSRDARDQVQEQLDVWRDRADVYGVVRAECRSYQRTNANEFMAVTFAHWQDDRAKLESKHPEAAAMWDDLVGRQEVHTAEVDLETDSSDDPVVPDYVEAGRKVNIELDGEVQNRRGVSRSEFTNAEVVANHGNKVDVKLGPEKHTVPVDSIESMEQRAVGREPDTSRTPDLTYQGADIRDDPEFFEGYLADHELTVHYEGNERTGMRVDEITEDTIWLRDPTKEGTASEMRIPLEHLTNVEAYEL